MARSKQFEKTKVAALGPNRPDGQWTAQWQIA
jgi:hypothetical protein